MKCGIWLFTRDVPDFPDCVVEGRNLLEALDGTRKRLAVRLAEMVAQNLPLPHTGFRSGYPDFLLILGFKHLDHLGVVFLL